jgi:uncharacterized membrane protein
MITVTGLFDTRDDAQSAVQELIDSGWGQEDIGMVAARSDSDHPEVTNLAVKDAEKGAVVGGLAGLFLGLSELALPGVGPVLAGGWLVTALLGAGVGAATGGLVGALVELGVSHEEAKHLAEGVRRGGTLVTIKATEDRVGAVEDILRHHRAVNIQERAVQNP